MLPKVFFVALLIGAAFCNLANPVRSRRYKLNRHIRLSDVIQARGSWTGRKSGKGARFGLSLVDKRGGFVFYIDMRPEHGVIVMNTKSRRGWGKEVRFSIKAPHYWSGKYFYLKIHVEPKHYAVFTNGKFRKRFAHRLGKPNKHGSTAATQVMFHQNHGMKWNFLYPVCTHWTGGYHRG